MTDGGPSPLKSLPLDSEARLEDMLYEDPGISGIDLLIVGRQVRTSYGGYIDLLAVDADGRVHVHELKRGRTPRDVVAQTLDYGSWVKSLSVEDLEQVYVHHHDGETDLGEVFNLQGTPERLMAGEPIRADEHKIELQHTQDVTDHTITLALNGREVGAMDLSDNPLATQSRLGRLLVGRDYGTPVCADYQPPFPFTGQIQRVVCEDLSQPGPGDLRGQIISAVENG